MKRDPQPMSEGHALRQMISYLDDDDVDTLLWVIAEEHQDETLRWIRENVQCNHPVHDDVEEELAWQ